MPGFLQQYLPLILGGLAIALAAVASAHAVMYKRESRGAAAWVGLIWLSPFVGVVLYLLLGVNRIRRRAMARHGAAVDPAPLSGGERPADPLEYAIDRVGDFPRLGGHTVVVLENGDQAYPAMREALAAATTSVRLCTYIFDADRAGRGFRDELAACVSRGVEVRVLVDDVGARYSVPSITRALRRRGIRVARYGRSLRPWRMRYANLRNHRKILVVDGATAFAGGMNLREGNVLAWDHRSPTRDLHFRFAGPVVHQLDTVFCHDWEHVTGETLAPCAPAAGGPGTVRARCIADGPDRPTDSLRWSLLAALACSTERVRVVTPYFVPDSGLIAALGTAALRGVRVDIILPARGNLRLVQWATHAMLWQVLEQGCRVFLTAPPFDHSKLMRVDDDWCFVGSANWDARSLRLNFEVNVECVDENLCRALDDVIDRKLALAREITLADADGRSVPVRVRDGVARLFSPFL